MKTLGTVIKSSGSVHKARPYMIAYHHNPRLIKTVTTVINVSLWRVQPYAAVFDLFDQLDEVSVKLTELG